MPWHRYNEVYSFRNTQTPRNKCAAFARNEPPTGFAPLVNMVLHAMPHAYGEISPRLGEFFDNNDLKSKDGQPISSARYPIRSSASPDAGVGRLKPT